MKNPNTFAVSFKARAARGEGNNAAIYLKITVNKVIREASLKYAVDLKYRDNKRGRPKLVNEQ